MIRRIKYLFLFSLIMLACAKQPEMIYDHSAFADRLHRHVSLLDSLQMGDTLSVTGIYDFRQLNNISLPVLMSFQDEVKHVLLCDSLQVKASHFVEIIGTVVQDTILVKPATPVVLTRLHVNAVQPLMDFAGFKEKAQSDYEQYRKTIEAEYLRRNIDLNLPARFFWRLVYNEKNKNVIVYTLVERISQIIELDFVYDTNKNLQSIFVMEHIDIDA